MFEIGLKRNRGDIKTKNHFFEDFSVSEIDSSLAVIIEACDRLQELSLVKFTVKGFGKDSWDVDVSYDLSTIIEQLPSFFQWIDKGALETYELDFFAQGTERSLFFQVINEQQVMIECQSRTKWQPSQKRETSRLKILDRMFSQLLKTFISEVKFHFSDLAKHPYFVEWCSSTHIYKRLGKDA